MLFLRTGLPGSGKTLNTIKEIDEEHQPDPENLDVRLHKDPDHPDLPVRTIYYNGIPELKIDKLKSKWVEWDTPDRWYELPDGCVIVVDEAQGTFGTDLGRSRIEKVTRFEKHRHQGWDIHLITQHPSLLSQPVRKLVGKHINFIRPYGRTKGVFRHEYEMCIDSPEKRVNFKMAQESKIEFDSHYFGLYKSATVHTHKKVTPRFIKMLPVYAAAIILPLAGLVYLFYWVYSSANAEKASINAQSAAVATAVAPDELKPDRNLVPKARAPATEVDFAKSYEPRVKDLAMSAPRYDSLNKPRDFPKPICMASQDLRMVSTAKDRGFNTGVSHGIEQSCQCYSQQATRMKTSFEFCMDVVENGYFDDTKLQPVYATGNSKNGPTSRPSVDPAVATQRGPAAASPRQVARQQGTTADPYSQNASTGTQYTVVADSEYVSRPWH
jgi:hypothetical protein